jgi:hypothetical protein
LAWSKVCSPKHLGNVRFCVGIFEVQNLVFIYWGLGSFVLKCASKDDEDFFKKTSTAIDVQTWTMWYEHGGPKEYMFPLVSGPDRYV